MADQQVPTLWIGTDGGPRRPRPLRIGSHVVGRSPAAGIRVASDWVSQQHAEFTWDGVQLRVRDLGSRNGTSVNGTTVVSWVVLGDGDVITLANVQAVVELADPGPTISSPMTSHRAGALPGPSGPGHDHRRPSSVPIFVSHSSQDKVAARSVGAYLRRAGWAVWIDEAGIAGGKDWRGELVQALEGTWAVVLLVSLDSMRSKWVIREVQAADRLGKPIIPVLVDDAPYPDALRMILGGVQQLYLPRSDDQDSRGQLLRLDDALIRIARQGVRTPPGARQIAVGNVLRVIGIVGLVVGFVLFALLGFLTVQSADAGSAPGDFARPLIGWGIFVASIIVAGIGEGIRRAGLRKGI